MMETCADLPSAADTNNNTNVEKCEKYSLRPRAVPKREDEEFEAWKPRSKCKKRVKQKPAPLSKYRRKTANARERCRMREINEGFEALRRVLPHLAAEKDNNEKLTKISTLRLAMKYIAALNRILQDPDVESDGESFFSEYTATDVSDQASLTPPAFSDHSFCTDFSDQLLSPSDFADSILPASSSDLDIASTLPLASDFSLSDFVVSSSASSSSLSSSSSSTSSDMHTLDSCLPELHFDDSEYAFDSLNYMANLS